MKTKEAKHVGGILINIKSLTIKKAKKGYFIKSGRNMIHLPDATNFEWRIKNPVEIKHMYFGTETGKFRDLSFNVTFNEATTLKISNPDARCYIYIDNN